MLSGWLTCVQPLLHNAPVHGALLSVYCQQSQPPAIAAADDLHALRELEKQMDIEPDWNTHAYMRAETVENRKRSVLTAFVIRMLGLGICADTEVWPMHCSNR